MTAPQVITTYPSRVVLRDPSLPHQIVITTSPDNSHRIYISCNCLLRPQPSGNGPPRYEPLETRSRWEAHEALAVWRAHMAEVAA